MKKGVILSVNKRFITLLTPEGEFLKTKRQEREYEVGEEITFSPIKQKVTLAFPNFNSSFKKKAVLSIASTFLILFSFFPSYFSGHVSAYMTIDVNPSIELELDHHLEVLKLTGLNEDGKLVIGQLKDWKGKDIKTVTNRIVETTKQLGYLKEKKQIIVSTTVLDKDKKLDKNLKKEIKEISEQNNVSNTKMKVIQATKSDRKQAREQGISTGKYVEKKLHKDKEKVKVNTREPAPATDKKVEEKVIVSKEKSKTLSTENKSVEEKKKENNPNELKQKSVNVVKPTEQKKQGTPSAQNKEKPKRENKNGKPNEINDFKGKSMESKGKPVSNQNNHSNQLKDKQKNEKEDKRLDEKRNTSVKEKGREREQNNDNHIKHENKKVKQDWDKWKKGNGNNGNSNNGNGNNGNNNNGNNNNGNNNNGNGNNGKGQGNH
ncbi:anti-sigma-I factor RsgI family protein [Peribacillus simplex]|uniref:anti-sigma factor domain-containing protein n=1 Tax=Peribacillus simplex TaxID=1478 RepID=UPI003D2C5B8E